MSPNDRHGPIRTEDEARQGVTPHMTRYVLTIGIALTVIAFLIIYLLVF